MSQDNNNNTRVIRCVSCNQPVMSNVGQCPHCQIKITGKEPDYVAFTPAAADWRDHLKPMMIGYGMAALLWMVGLGKLSSVLFVLVTIIYAFKMLREL